MSSGALGKYEQDLEENLDLIRSDLGIQYGERCKMVLNEFEQLNKYIRTKTEIFTLSLSANVRALTIKEIRDQDIDLGTNKRRVGKFDSSAVLPKFLNKPSTKKPKRKSSGISKKVLGSKRKSILAKKSSKRISRTLSSRSIETKKKKPSSVADDSYVELDDSDDEVFFTPSAKQLPKKNYITPKFDTSKPLKRSLMRSARPGEVAISLSGSPLFLEGLKPSRNKSRASEHIQVNIGKKTYHFSDPQPRAGNLDKKELQKIAALKKTLDQMTRQ